jgi:hypothetical protein
MHVRDYEEADLPDLERIHSEMGFDYKMQNMESPLVLTRKVILNDDGRIIGACYTVVQVEACLLLDPELGPAEKVDAITEVDAEVSSDSYAKGLDQQVAYLPPGVEERFQKRLKQMGWEPGRPEWKLWVKDLV